MAVGRLLSDAQRARQIDARPTHDKNRAGSARAALSMKQNAQARAVSDRVQWAGQVRPCMGGAAWRAGGIVRGVIGLMGMVDGSCEWNVDGPNGDGWLRADKQRKQERKQRKGTTGERKE